MSKETDKEKLIAAWPKIGDQLMVSVGIMTCKEVSIFFSGDYKCGAEIVSDKKIDFSVSETKEEINFIPTEEKNFFRIDGVTIGIGFHWQRRETQSFSGALKLLPTEDGLVVINQLPVEEYLRSVISSEMSANAGLELLRAHAVISRSWLLRTKETQPQVIKPENAHLKFYERDAHTLFDVCADDHCQRYQGLHRQINDNVNQAISDTRGMVLTYEGEICDARFSKCCGGKTERFSTAWADVDYAYLQPVECPYCDTHDKKVLSQVLNDYDTETVDFHDWRVEYSVEELSDLVRRRSGVDFGEIQELKPLERGESGRIWQLEVVGSKRRAVIGKELEIRKLLSESHLYSSAFDVEKIDNKFILRGKGWGHGVGLCQIGAAVMAEKGFSYKEILAHYYPNSSLTKLY